MRQRCLAAATAILLNVACGTSPTQPARTEAAAPRPPATDAVPSAAAVPTAPPAAEPVEKPFALRARVDASAVVSVLDDTLGVVVLATQEDRTTRAVAFELKGERFERLGERTFLDLERPGYLARNGTSTYFEISTPMYRSIVEVLVPVTGPDKRVIIGDPALMNASRYRQYVTDCEKPLEGAVALSKLGELIELASSKAVVYGDACDQSPVLAFVDGAKITKLPVTPTARIFETHFGVVLDDDKKVKIIDASGAVTEASAPMLPDETLSVVKAPDGAFIASTKEASFIARGAKWVRLSLADRTEKFWLVPGKTTLWAFVERSEGGTDVHKFLTAGETAPAVADTKDVHVDGGRPTLAATRSSVAERAPGPKCKNNVVVLYGFTKVTPDDYDFPLTRKALKGHRELGGVRFVVAEDAGKKYLVGRTQSFDQAVKLARVIEKGVQGSKPQVVCAQPKELRELAIDLETGNVK